MHRKSISFVLAVALACGAAAFSGCGKQCTLKGCQGAVVVDVRDAAGTKLLDYSVSATVAGATLSVSCAAGTPRQSEGARIGDNTVSLDCQGDGPFRIWQAAGFNYDISVSITDQAQHAYSGKLAMSITTDENFNGPGCGSCSSGTAEVSLR